MQAVAVVDAGVVEQDRRQDEPDGLAVRNSEMGRDRVGDRVGRSRLGDIDRLARKLCRTRHRQAGARI